MSIYVYNYECVVDGRNVLYTGYINDNKPHGKGSYYLQHYSNNERLHQVQSYMGDFLDGVRNGKGTSYYEMHTYNNNGIGDQIDSYTYTGDIADNYYSGQCVYEDAHVVISGQFYQNYLNGEGKKINKYKNSISTGYFIKDKLIHGKMIDSDGQIYEGEFHNECLINGTTTTPKEICTGRFARGYILTSGKRTIRASMLVEEGEFAEEPNVLCNGKRLHYSMDGILLLSEEGKFQNSVLVDGVIRNHETGLCRIIDQQVNRSVYNVEPDNIFNSQFEIVVDNIGGARTYWPEDETEIPDLVPSLVEAGV